MRVNCAAVPRDLFESELFGHERGAFTGATGRRRGKFARAHQGTLFLDEVGEIPLELQSKLLRALEAGEIEPVGAEREVQVDVRVVAATNRDLERAVREGAFREDLYYRIRVVPITLPPLRERGQADTLRLVEHFVEKFSKRHERHIDRIAESALQKIQNHPFPGNIRELENLIESAVVLCENEVIEARDIQFAPRMGIETPASTVAPLAFDAGNRSIRIGDPDISLEMLEQTHIRQVVEAMDGNQSEAARRLGIGRNTLARKLSMESQQG